LAAIPDHIANLKPRGKHWLSDSDCPNPSLASFCSCFAGAIVPSPPPPSRNRKPRRTAASIARTIFIRRRGDLCIVSVEPHPDIRGFHGYNRALASRMAAASYAQATQDKKGWPIVDEVAGDIGHGDPCRSLGRAAVFVTVRPDGLTLVALLPTPWGKDPAREFDSFGAAYTYATQLSQDHADKRGPLNVVAT
jgi:hypothetical protein